MRTATVRRAGVRLAAACLALALVPALGACSSSGSGNIEGLGANPGRAAKLAERAKKAAEDNQFERAIALYQESTQLDPNIGAVWLNYGALLLESGSYLDAQGAFQKAERLDPASPLPHVNKGIAWLRAGYADDALNHFRAALALDPNHLGALRGVARAQEDLQAADRQTLDAIDRALQAETDPAWRDYLFRQRARVRQALGMPDEVPAASPAS